MDNEENCALGLQDFLPGRFDLVIATSDLLPVSFCRKYVREGGALAITYVPEDKSVVTVGTKWSLGSLVHSWLNPCAPLSVLNEDIDYSNLDRLGELIDLGVLQPVLDSVHPLEDAALALGAAGEKTKGAAAVGKTVIQF